MSARQIMPVVPGPHRRDADSQGLGGLVLAIWLEQVPETGGTIVGVHSHILRVYSYAVNGWTRKENMGLAPHIRRVNDDLRLKARSASDAWKQRIGAAVKAARERAGMSQATLADLVGANLSTVSDIERGVSVPNLSTAWAIADRLALALDDLVGRDSVKPPATVAEGGPRSQEAPLPAGAVLDSFEELQGQIDAIRDFVGMQSEPRAKRAWRRSA
jgi:transcriptional regulator with XRE-family HTH domain